MKGLLGRKLIVIVVAAVVVLGGASGAFFFLPALVPTIGIGNAQGASDRPPPEAARPKEGSPAPGMMYPMKERIVNLADSGGFHYLKVELVLEFDLPEAKALNGEAYKKRQDEFIKEMASRRPILDDIVTTVLASKTSASISSAEGKEKLRDELKSKLGEAAGEHKLLNAYFTQFIIQ